MIIEVVWQWVCVDWHWAMIVGAVLLLICFGFVVIEYDTDSGDWWMF